MYAVVYSLVLLFGLVGNLLALWMLRAYVKETKKGVMFMINLAVADLLQVTFASPFVLHAITNTFRRRTLNQEINSKNVKAREPMCVFEEKKGCVCRVSNR